MSTSTPHLVATLYRDHHTWLHHWLRRRLGCGQQAADLAQDTFVRLLAARTARLGEVREPRAYLTIVAQGLLVDHFRRRALERAYAQALAAQPEALAPSPEERHEVIQALMAVDRMLDGLPAKARAAWLYSRLDGLAHADIAAHLGVSQSRVRQYLASAAKRCYQLRFGSAP